MKPFKLRNSPLRISDSAPNYKTIDFVSPTNKPNKRINPRLKFEEFIIVARVEAEYGRLEPMMR